MVQSILVWGAMVRSGVIQGGIVWSQMDHGGPRALDKKMCTHVNGVHVIAGMRTHNDNDENK